jgi:hypothetical protein
MKTFLIVFSVICISLLVWFHFKPAPHHETPDYIETVSTIKGNWHLLKLLAVSPTETSSYIPKNIDEIQKIITDTTFENISNANGNIITFSGKYKFECDTIYVEYISSHPISEAIGDSMVYTVHLWGTTMILYSTRISDGVELKITALYSKN